MFLTEFPKTFKMLFQFCKKKAIEMNMEFLEEDADIKRYLVSS
jgi:hypothetical protein